MHQLHHGALAAGSHQVVVAADGLASGVYLARLVAVGRKDAGGHLVR